MGVKQESKKYNLLQLLEKFFSPKDDPPFKKKKVKWNQTINFSRPRKRFNCKLFIFNAKSVFSNKLLLASWPFCYEIDTFKQKNKLKKYERQFIKKSLFSKTEIEIKTS